MRQILNLREFGEMLHRAGNEWGCEIIDLYDSREGAYEAIGHNERIMEMLGYKEPYTEHDMEKACEQIGEFWDERNEVHEILVKFGAIGADDHETSIADILRVLLL